MWTHFNSIKMWASSGFIEKIPVNSHNRAMSDRHLQRPYPLRMPDHMRTKFEEAATSGGRSLHAEILRRLESSLKSDAEPQRDEKQPAQQPVGGDLSWYLTAQIKDLAEQQGVAFDEMLAKIFVAGLHPDAPQVLYVPILPGASTQELRAAMQASEGIVRPDAAIVSEMIQRAPWAPSWIAERLAEPATAERSLPQAADAHPDLAVGDNASLPAKRATRKKKTGA